MAINLLRNSRVFFTTNLNSDGRVKAGTFNGTTLRDTAFSESNTYEIQVLEGMSFSQATTQDTVTLNEGGATPSRGQRSFNTALAPAEFSFSTYIRPYKNPSGNFIQAEESLLWNAFASAAAIGGGSAGWTQGTSSSQLTLANSDKHQLQAFGLIIVFGDGAYVIDNCALDTATIDFGLDAIAAVQWAGKGTQLRSLDSFSIDTNIATPVTFMGSDVNSGASTEAATVTFSTVATSAAIVIGGLTYTNGATALSATQAASIFANMAAGATASSVGLSTGTFSGTFGQFNAGSVSGTSSNQVIFTANLPYTNVTDFTSSGAGISQTISQGAVGTAGTDVAKVKNTVAKYITNKLSTLDIQSTINTSSGTTYSIALTGGSITLANNLTYLTPANLGTVNLPITYFTGTRSITGTLTAYLKTGNTGSGVSQSAKLLKALLDNSATAIDPDYAITVNLGGTASPKVLINVPAAMLQIPSVNTEQVISTTINFTGQGSSNNAFDITASNEVNITYYSIL